MILAVLENPGLINNQNDCLINLSWIILFSDCGPKQVAGWLEMILAKSLNDFSEFI